MIQHSSILGIGAGLVSALLFITAANGTPMAFVLYSFSPLPAYLVGLGWGPLAVLWAVFVGLIVVALTLSVNISLAFLFVLMVPALILCVGALSKFKTGPSALSAQTDAPSQADATPQTGDGTEWMPIGLLILFACLWAGLLGAVSVLLLGSNIETYNGTIKAILDQFVAAQRGKVEINTEQYKMLFTMMTQSLPALSAVLWSMITLGNMWLAAKIIQKSDKLIRPWPVFSDLYYPPQAGFILIAAIGASFLPGIIGLMASAFSAALGLAYIMLGLSIIYLWLKTIIADAIYFFIPLLLIILIFPFVSIIPILLALGEPYFQLKQRFKAQKPPPAPPQ